MNTITDGPAPEHPDESRLNDLIDGNLPPEAAERVRRHAETCDVCRGTILDLEALRIEARDLVSERLPERDLWPDVNARIQTHRRLDIQARSRWERLRLWTGKDRSRLAWGPVVAAGVAAVVAGLLLLTDDPRSQVSGPAAAVDSPDLFVAELREIEDPYRPEIEELRTLVDARELSPETREVLEENLAIIDRAIEESRAAVRSDPQGYLVLQDLRRIYDDKVRVLRTVAGVY